MKEVILIAGGTGLVGNRLLELIDFEKYSVKILTRKKRPSTKHIRYYEWNLDSMTIEEDALKADYIINLTGAGIADKRWSISRKKVLIDSRVKSAQLILKGVVNAKTTPKAYISSSAIGYYGDRGDENLSESSTKGNGFLSDCCSLWEQAASEFKSQVSRQITLRIGIVLSKRGGALSKIIMTKGIGVFTYFGNGMQYYSWIHIDDLCKIILQSIEDKKMTGIYNAVSTHPIVNLEFTQIIRRLFRGVICLPVPAFLLRTIMGEMADVLLYSNRVSPSRLQEAGFIWDFDNLEAAISDLKNRNI